MADLRKFQDRSQTQANLSAVPATPPPNVGGVQALVGFVEGFGAPAASAFLKGVEREEKTQLKTTIGELTTKLAKAQQAGMVDDRINVPAQQRKIYTEWAANNPALAAEGAKAFSEATGIKVAGLSAEQQAQQELQEAAWSAGFGDPTATPEENAKQLDIYQNIQRETKQMEFNAKKEQADKDERKRDLLKSTSKLATWKTDSLQATLDADLQAIRNGAPREQFVGKWAKLSVDWSNTIAQFGEFANDETIKAQLSGVEEMLTLGKGMVDGSLELPAIQNQSAIATAKQQAILTADPEGAKHVALSKMFGNLPITAVAINNYIKNVLAKDPKEPADARTTNGTEKKTIREALDNMAKSEDLEAKTQAGQQVVQVAKHMERNGIDYTDDELLEVCSMIAVPEVFKTLDTEGKAVVQSACETYAVDVAGKAIREIEQNATITLPTVATTPEGRRRPGVLQTLTLNDFADMQITDAGMRYTAKGEWKNWRRIQRHIQDLNRQLSKVDPVAQLLAAATGESVEEVAARTWQIGPVAEQEAQEAALQQLPVGAGVNELIQGFEQRVEQRTEQPTGAPGPAAVGAVARELPAREGVGDAVTNIATGPIGVTQSALDAVGMSNIDPETLSTEQAQEVATQYLTQLDQEFQNNLPGYERLSENAKQAVLDVGYNLGRDIVNFPAFSAAVEAGDEQEAVRQLLDTANVGNQSVRGLARRRAEAYNLVADNPIAKVRQEDDGTIIYLDSDGNVVFSYTAKGGRHESSASGTLTVN